MRSAAIVSFGTCQFGVRRLVVAAGAPTAGWSVRVWAFTQLPKVSRLRLRENWRLLSFVVACCSTLFSTAAHGEPPSLSRLVPAGGRRGSMVVSQCQGKFSWPVKAWAPGIHVRVSEEKGKLDISIPHDLAADRVWIRLFNDDGASTARPFLIGALEEVYEQEPNDALKSAQEVSSDDPSAMGAEVTINGVLQKRGDVDTFAVRLAAGQTSSDGLLPQHRSQTLSGWQVAPALPSNRCPA